MDFKNNIDAYFTVNQNKRNFASFRHKTCCEYALIASRQEASNARVHTNYAFMEI